MNYMPWEEKVEKTAATVKHVMVLPDDPSMWIGAITDYLYSKYDFLKKYPMVIKPDKKDDETRSAIIYAVVTLSNGERVSIPIMISSGKLLPIMPMEYKGQLYPIMREVIDEIERNPGNLGDLVDIPKIRQMSPWQFMINFSTRALMNKESMIKRVESLSESVIEKIAKIDGGYKFLEGLLEAPKELHVKTAAIENGVYSEYKDGELIRRVYTSGYRFVSSNHMKVAEINEAMSKGENAIKHEVNETPNKKVKFIGDNSKKSSSYMSIRGVVCRKLRDAFCATRDTLIEGIYPNIAKDVKEPSEPIEFVKKSITDESIIGKYIAVASDEDKYGPVYLGKVVGMVKNDPETVITVEKYGGRRQIVIAPYFIDDDYYMRSKPFDVYVFDNKKTAGNISIPNSEEVKTADA